MDPPHNLRRVKIVKDKQTREKIQRLHSHRWMKQMAMRLEQTLIRRPLLLRRDPEGNLTGPGTVFPSAMAIRHSARLKPPETRPGLPLQARLSWWKEVLAWLQDLANAINDSLCKELDDTSVLTRDRNDRFSAGYGIVAHGRAQEPSGSQVEKNPDLQERWLRQQRRLHVCNLKKSFYGPKSFPAAAKLPSFDDLMQAEEYIVSHEAYLFRHWDHMEYQDYLIRDKLIPEVEGRIEELETEAQMPSGIKANLHEGTFPDQKQCDYMFPESEEEYPDDPDEQEEHHDVLDEEEHHPFKKHQTIDPLPDWTGPTSSSMRSI